MRIQNVGNYEDGDIIPSYHPWHPFDHYANSNKDKPADGITKIGNTIGLQEVFSYDRYEQKYAVDEELKVWFLKDGNAGGFGLQKKIPFLGTVSALRAVWNTTNDGTYDGVHLHYEIVAWIPMGLDAVAAPTIEQFGKWQRHGAQEDGAMENFLPRLYEQRDKLGPNPAEWVLDYDAAIDNKAKDFPLQTGSFDPDLVKKRMDSYQNSDDPMQHLLTTNAFTE